MTRARRVLGGWLLAAGLVVALGAIGASSVIEAHQEPGWSCAMYGPLPVSPPLASELEGPGPVGHVVLFGRECVWPRADGAGTVTTHLVDWADVTVSGAGALLAIAGLALLLPVRRGQRPKRSA